MWSGCLQISSTWCHHYMQVKDLWSRPVCVKIKKQIILELKKYKTNNLLLSLIRYNQRLCLYEQRGHALYGLGLTNGR